MCLAFIIFLKSYLKFGKQCATMEVHLIIQKDVHYMISGETRYSLFVKKYIYINEND